MNTEVHEAAGWQSADQIQRIYTMLGGQQVIVLRDGTAVELSDRDVEVLEMAFDSECQNCGFDPNADPFEDSSDSADEDEGYEDDQVGSNENMEDEDD